MYRPCGIMRWNISVPYWVCKYYRNSFMGRTVEYCIRKDGLTYHDRNMERLASGLQYKISQLKEQAALPKDTDDSMEINAETVHRNMGYCLTGIEAFAEDYGLDVARTYTLKELKDVIHEQGYKPSLEIQKRSPTSKSYLNMNIFRKKN